ncbi:MAG TPA: PIN domain-containing protein, partial [Acidobacteriaceae bacterium]|nr:PIN domain-containing protein [Acidobacteriaceae bacterium]
MSRIFFDSMLFVYLLEDHPTYSIAVEQVLQRCYERKDVLLTSSLAVGEVMAGWKSANRAAEDARAIIREMGFQLAPFDESCISTFARLRSELKLKAADAIHLTCAAAAGTDMFLTNDRQLLQRRLYVPGIQFIA